MGYLDGGVWPCELVTCRQVAVVGQGLTKLQGVTVDFWGGPHLHLWPQQGGGPAPPARMYREQLGLMARSVGDVGHLAGFNGFSFETEE